MIDDDIIKIMSALMQTGENIRVTSNYIVINNGPDDNLIINTAHMVMDHGFWR